MLAWAAGLFEGEGTILNYVGADGRWVRRLALVMTDEDVVKRFHQVVGSGKMSGPTQRENPDWKPIWTWRCTKQADCAAILKSFLPYLGERRTKAALALIFNPAGPAHRPRSSHCKNGHEMSEENVVVDKRGCRACGICRREYRKQRARDRRAKGLPV